MFDRLVQNIRNKNMCYFIPEGIGIECNNIPTETMDLIVKLFSQNNIKSSICSLKTKTSDDKKLFTFSYENFRQLRTVLQWYEHNYSAVPVHPNHIMYNALSENDWKRFKSYVDINFDGVPSFAKNIAQDCFIKILKMKSKDSVIVNYVLNGFLDYTHFCKKNNIPMKVKLDTSSREKANIKRNIGGFSTLRNRQPYIWMAYDNLFKTDNIKLRLLNFFKYTLRYPTKTFQHLGIFINPEELATTFIHELRHITQIHHELDTISSVLKKRTPLCIAISELAMESETRPCDLLIEKPQFATDILTHHYNQTLIDILNKTENITQFDSLKPAKKLAATLKYVQIESYKKSLQTLSECYLSKSRLDVYRKLKNQGISLEPEEFNHLSCRIESWKSHYFKKGLNSFIQNDNRTPTLSQELKPLEELWKKTTGLNMNLAPSVIFSEEIAHNLGIYDLIYETSDKNEKPKEMEYNFQYQGLNEETASVRQLFEDRKYHEIFDIYNNLRQQNSFLPPIFKKNSAQQTAENLVAAIMEMHMQSSPKNVLNRLDYCLHDEFDKVNWNKELIGKYAKGIKINRQNER